MFLTPSGINDEKQRNTVVNEIIRLRDSDKENNKLAVDVINASEAFFSENSAENLTLGNLYGAGAYEKIVKVRVYIMTGEQLRMMNLGLVKPNKKNQF